MTWDVLSHTTGFNKIKYRQTYNESDMLRVLIYKVTKNKDKELKGEKRNG